MKPLFKQLILDFQAKQLPNGIERDLKTLKIPDTLRKARVFIGVRRCGKTWSMYQQIARRKALSIDKTKSVYINFADDRLLGAEIGDMQKLLDAYFELYPHLTEDPAVTFYLDEVHEVTHWELFIRRVLDQEKIQIVISGSSAKLLSKEIATQLRGRSLTQEVFPFDFREYLRAYNLVPDANLTSREKNALYHHQHLFLTYGGFPETVGMDAELHRELLQNYMELILFRDIVERYRLQYNPLLKELFTHCAQNSASLLSINKMYNKYKSMGRKISKDTLYNYLGYFEDCYGVFPVSLFSHSTYKSQVNPKKMYVVDQGLITACTVKPGFDKSAELETAVFLQIRRKRQKIHYFKTASGKEVDFLFNDDSGSLNLVQVCVNLADEQTKSRETSALWEAGRELETDKLFLVTLDLRTSLHSPWGTIECYPFWEWLTVLE